MATKASLSFELGELKCTSKAKSFDKENQMTKMKFYNVEFIFESKINNLFYNSDRSNLSSNKVSPPNMDPIKAPSFLRMRLTSLKNPGRLLIQCADNELTKNVK